MVDIVYKIGVGGACIFICPPWYLSQDDTFLRGVGSGDGVARRNSGVGVSEWLLIKYRWGVVTFGPRSEWRM